MICIYDNSQLLQSSSSTAIIQNQKSTWHWKFFVDYIEQISEATGVGFLNLLTLPNRRWFL